MQSTVSSVRSIRLGDVLEGLSGGVSRDDAPAQVPPYVAGQIREMIGKRWRVLTTDVCLRWGAAPTTVVISTSARFRLVGEGTDGWFVVIFRNPGQPGTAVRLRAGVDCRIPVAARALFAGRIVGDADILYQKTTRWGSPSASLRRTGEPGWRVMSDVGPGTPLVPPQVLPERMILQGDTVRLRWRRGVVSVALEGSALHDAAEGQRVTVLLRGDRGESSGIVTGPGEAALDA